MRGYGKWHFENYGGAENQTYHYEQSEGDIVALLKRVHEVFPGKPVYLLGESLGANMGMLISGKYPQLSDGCILVSTYSRFRMFFQPYMLVHTVQAILLPKSKLNLMPYLKKRLTNSKEAIKAYIQDPFGRRKQAPRELGKSFVFNVRAKKYALQIPDSEAVLFIHGGKDKLCNPNSSFKLYNQMPAGNKEFVFLPTNGHLMVERPDIPAEVLETIVEWLDSQGN
jgi:alpha-beta hydrolase superfamily lysophospholipase